MKKVSKSVHAALRRSLCCPVVYGMLTCILPCGQAQEIAPGALSSANASNPLLTSTADPGTAFLFGLERKFSAAVAQGGGAAFASWFDPNGMTLADRQAPLIGQAAIAAHATWSSGSYRLTWTAEGGELSSDGAMGYTWGHYEGHAPGQAEAEHGRYVTVWKREPDGSWKVLLDTSNEEPPNAECKCSVPGKP